ncbi:MAG TPA: hypothetical protein VNJ08_06900 [Bacteriovoracaceae bacterium]|nr:hypothetical protein [Bacteriovoracaceae bacterium]
MKFFLVALFLTIPHAFSQHNHEHANHSAAKRKPVEAQEKKMILNILEKNDLLFNAFLKKDGATIEKKANELLAVVNGSKGSRVKDVKASATKLGQIKSSNKNEANLQAYESFLNPLIKAVQENDLGGNFNVFSCPMVKKSWIQDIKVNKEVKNVYAMEMLECGTQDTHF